MAGCLGESPSPSGASSASRWPWSARRSPVAGCYDIVSTRSAWAENRPGSWASRSRRPYAGSLCYARRPSPEPVLRGIDLRVESGEMLALIGPNGAGKSTRLRVAGGVLRPIAGRALLDNLDLAHLSAREIATRVAVVPQEGPLPAG